MGGSQSSTAGEIKDMIQARNGVFMKTFEEDDLGELVRAMYLPDSKVLPPGSPTQQGPEAIAGVFKGLKDNGIARIELTTKECDQLSSDYILEEGEGVLYKEEGSTAGKVKYVVTWKKHSNGEWYMLYDIFNSLE